MPLYKPDKEILRKIDAALRQQKFSGKYEVLKIDKSLGLAASMNYGIKKAKYPVIVSLHQDCIPQGKNWLAKLTAPLKEQRVSASVSRVHLPEKLWSSFTKSAQALTIKEKGVITPLMDEKGCAYRKDTLLEVGMFNDKLFRTAGEDFDMYLKLKEEGQIAYPDCEVLHIHPTYLRGRLKKTYQNANGYGALVRIHGKKMPRWYAGLVSALPIIGIISLLNYPWKKAGLLGGVYVGLTPLIHIFYCYGFWKGFLRGKQTV